MSKPCGNCSICRGEPRKDPMDYVRESDKIPSDDTLRALKARVADEALKLWYSGFDGEFITSDESTEMMRVMYEYDVARIKTGKKTGIESYDRACE